MVVSMVVRRMAMIVNSRTGCRGTRTMSVWDRRCPILLFSVPRYQSIPFIIVMHRPRVSIISFPIAASNSERAHTHVGVHPTSIRLGIGHPVRQMRR